MHRLTARRRHSSSRYRQRFLRALDPHLLRIETTMQAMRWGGLDPFRIGPVAELRAQHTRSRAFRNEALGAYALGMALVGLAAAAVWLQTRESQFGVFALAAAFGVVRNLDRSWPDSPLPWPLWGGLVAVCYATHLSLMNRFVLMTVGATRGWILRSVDASLAVAASLAAASFAWHWPVGWDLGLKLLWLASVLALGIAAWTVRADRRLWVWLMIGAGLASVLAGLHDVSGVRLGLADAPRPSLTPHAVFLFVLAMALYLGMTHVKAVEQIRVLSATLAQRVTEREAQLDAAYQSLREQERQQVLAAERQRLMRDIHDGVGVHLSGLASIDRQSTPVDATQIASQARQALDELHIAIDALQPVDGDLAVVLGALRYRVQQRLAQAGIELRWNVDDLPPLDNLTPTAVSHIQRIVLEALTNAMRHAKASVVEINAHCDREGPAGRASRVDITIRDNGRGSTAFPAGAATPRGPAGHGLNNMRARAAALGAQLDVTQATSGTKVSLSIPIAAEPTAAAS